MPFRRDDRLYLFHLLCPLYLPSVTTVSVLSVSGQQAPEDNGVEQEELMAAVLPEACLHWWPVWVGGLIPL